MTSAILIDQLLDPVTDAFTPEMARRIAELRAGPEIEHQLEEWRHKANEGALTAEEDARYKEFLEALDVVSILQAKARRFLQRTSTK